MQTDSAFDVISLKMERLPTLPGIAMRMLEAVQKEDPDLAEIGNIISTDSPLSAEVLKIINSSFYGLPSKITSVYHAINMLALLQCIPKQYSLVLNEMENSDYAYHEAENQILGFNHMDAGEYLVKTWGLPETFSTPIGRHHNPGVPTAGSNDIARLTKILHLSSLYIDFFKEDNPSLNLGLLEAWVQKHGFSDQINVDEIGLAINACENQFNR